MRERATHLIYKAAGAPPMDGGAEGVCRTCGMPGVGTPFAGWVKPTFTDHDLLLPGDIVCHACLYGFSDACVELQRRVSKDKPQRMRNYSHFIIDGQWLPLSKGDKDGMIAALARRPEVAVIAVSGQKHLIFRAAAGWWQIEESARWPFPDELWLHLGLVELLYSGGFSKTEIESGRYRPARVFEIGLQRYMALESAIAPARGTLEFECAVFLAQRRDLDDDGRLPAGIPYGAEAAHAVVARHTRRLQAQVRPQHLAAVRGQHQDGGVYQQGDAVRQLDLFTPANPDSGARRGDDE